MNHYNIPEDKMSLQFLSKFNFFCTQQVNIEHMTLQSLKHVSIFTIRALVVIYNAKPIHKCKSEN